MIAGEKVRLKAASPFASRLNLPEDAEGAVICCYKVLRGGVATQKMDVQFSAQLVLWGVPADAFELAGKKEKLDS